MICNNEYPWVENRALGNATCQHESDQHLGLKTNCSVTMRKHRRQERRASGFPLKPRRFTAVLYRLVCIGLQFQALCSIFDIKPG